MGLSVLATLCAVIAGMLMWKRPQTRRTQSWLLLVVGLAASGLVGGLQDRVMALATDASADATARLFGVGAPFAFALVVVTWWVLDMDFDGLLGKMRKRGGRSNRHTTSAFTPWLGLFVPVSLAVLPVVSGVPAVLRDGVAQLAAALVG